jgi:hypothetical protein
LEGAGVKFSYIAINFDSAYTIKIDRHEKVVMLSTFEDSRFPVGSMRIIGGVEFKCTGSLGGYKERWFGPLRYKTYWTPVDGALDLIELARSWI